MKLRFLTTSAKEVDLRPNLATRDWMDKTGESFAYRCLPLNIANAHGWGFHLKHDFVVHWDGTTGTEAVTIKSDSEKISRSVSSIFGYGIITFHVHGVFQTEPGWNMMATGPFNEPKDGISPLTGVIETDWSPYSFTMNWQITRPKKWISFKKGEVFCNVFPVQRGILETVEPEFLLMSTEPELEKEHLEWGEARSKFNKDLKDPGSDAQKMKWQKAYYRGKRWDGSDGPEDHMIKLRLKEFENKTKKKSK